MEHEGCLFLFSAHGFDHFDKFKQVIGFISGYSKNRWEGASRYNRGSEYFRYKKAKIMN